MKKLPVFMFITLLFPSYYAFAEKSKPELSVNLQEQSNNNFTNNRKLRENNFNSPNNFANSRNSRERLVIQSNHGNLQNHNSHNRDGGSLVVINDNNFRAAPVQFHHASAHRPVIIHQQPRIHFRSSNIWWRSSIGVPWWDPFPHQYPNTPIIIEKTSQAPVVYVERSDNYQDDPKVTVTTNPSNNSANAWYYCQSSNEYYPKVRSCPEGWEKVPLTPN